MDEKSCARCHKVLGDGACVDFFRRDGDEEPRLVRSLCQPCHVLEQLNEHARTGRIRTSLALEVQLDEAMAESRNRPMRADFRPVAEDLERVYAGIRAFSPYWPQIVAASDAEPRMRGLSMELAPGAKLMTWTMCARIMATIETDEHSITLLGNDHLNQEEPDLNGCFFRGIGASADEAVRLLDLAAQAGRDGRLSELAPDKGVSYCGI